MFKTNQVNRVSSNKFGKQLNLILGIFTFFIIFTLLSFSNRLPSITNLKIVQAEIISMDLSYDGGIYPYKAEKVHIEIDGNSIETPIMEPIILDSRTLVPLRSTFENMGAEVSWDNNTRSAIIEKDNIRAVFTINETSVLKQTDDVLTFIQIDVPAKLINGNTMVPVRAVSDALGYYVDWNNSTRTVIISSNPINNTTTQDTTSNVINTTIEPTTVITTIASTIAPNYNTGNSNQKSNGLKILWDQVTANDNDTVSKRIPVEGLDVLCPTWFQITDTSGNVADIGSIEYVNWAKAQGYDVWGLVTNSFNSSLTTSVLSNPTSRANVINQLISYAKKYNLDGINIDFEGVSSSDGDIYLTFIKEATQAFKANNLVTSVDTFVPAPWTTQYKLAEVAQVVDYVIIMAYDEHYRTSPTSGSTASYTWVKKYMDEAISKVDKNKLIMGVPFYTRLWSEQTQADGSIVVVDSVAKTMDEVKQIISSRNLTPVWIDSAKQYYVEYRENNLTYKLWIEDATSIEERMKLSRTYDLKGVAMWKRGYESSDIWSIINKYY